MVGLTEFIIASRANKIIRNSRLSNLSYTAIDKNECGLYKDAAENFLSKNISAEEAVKYQRSEEHTSELQSPSNLVCRLLLEKKK